MAENPNPAPPPADGPQPRPPFNELSVLFPIMAIYTAGYLALMVADFLFKGALPLPTGMMPIYIALVGAYAADKEIRRWAGVPEPLRKGSLFVYLWALFYLVAFMIRVFRPEFGLPAELDLVALQVLAIFFGSRASKYVWETRQKQSGEADPGYERQILDLIAAKGQITRREIIEQLGVSGSTANRLLQGLEARNLVRRVGEGRGVSYVLP